MSLFNRPAWAAKAQEASDSEPGDSGEVNIFSHSNRAYRDIVAEQESKRRMKVERRRNKVLRRESGKREIDGSRGGEDGEGRVKKRRVSDERDQDGATSGEDSSGESPQVKRLGAPAAVLSPVRRSPRNKEIVYHKDPQAAHQTATRRDVIDLERPRDDEEQIFYEAREEPLQQPNAPQPRRARTEEDVEDESDEEFAALARRARERRQQKQQREQSSATPDLGGPPPNTTDTIHHSLPTPPPDPTVQLFISSPIPDTNPLIVARKLSQNLQQVRKVWCAKQGFSDALTSKIFFTHRMRRIYDVTTCRSLGLEVDAFGNLVMKGAEGKEGSEKVHLEAVTEEIFRDRKAELAEEAEREREAARRGVDIASGLDDVPCAEPRLGKGETETQAPPKEEPTLRVTLKAKGQADFKIKVRASTPISRMVEAYSKSRPAAGQKLFLEFDGERLSPDDEVGNTEIADMDCIDVHIARS